ncbi:hypothetical protein BDV93DRAFT_520989 [Ceratobasidium sp. AG-I]|nr:hypothetical protein BDV93DRAFT_520989 [Ceratobasidium sp. AG-I]
MATQKFPNISPAESDAHELLTVCYIRSVQISENIRTMEPDYERVKIIYDKALGDLRSKSDSIAHGPSRSDLKQRAAYLKRCREVFDGPHWTLHEYVIAFCAVFFAIQVIVELELGSSKYCGVLMSDANRRSVQFLTSGSQPASGVYSATLTSGVPQEAGIPRYLNAKMRYLGAMLSYTLDGNPRECHVIEMGTHCIEGDWFLVRDGPVGEQPEEMKISASEMDDLARSSEGIAYA